MSTGVGLHPYLQLFPPIYGLISEPAAPETVTRWCISSAEAAEVLLAGPEHLRYASDHTEAVDRLQTRLQQQKLPNFQLTKRKSYYPVGKYV